MSQLRAALFVGLLRALVCGDARVRHGFCVSVCVCVGGDLKAACYSHILCVMCVLIKHGVCEDRACTHTHTHTYIHTHIHPCPSPPLPPFYHTHTDKLGEENETRAGQKEHVGKRAKTLQYTAIHIHIRPFEES